MSHWSVTWTACWAAISAPRVSAIETYIQEKIPDMKGEELNQAVEALAVNWDSKVMGSSPGIGMLISSIKGARKRKAGIDMSEPYDVMVIRKRCLFLPLEGLSRWDLICETAVSLGSDAAHMVIKACINGGGGLVIPWWVSSTMPHTKQQPKPQGVTSWMDYIENVVEVQSDKGDQYEASF